MAIENLSPKFIMDFTEEDTIYISRETGSGNNKQSRTYLCKFKEYKGNRVIATAVSVDINPEIHKHEIEQGLELSAHIEKCALYGENPLSGKKYYHWFKASGYAIYPQEYDKVGENATVINEHPSFGLVRLTRRNSRGVVLFGSSITHNEIIALTISTAKIDRHLSRDWFHAKKEVIEIELSATQFAEFITTPNSGSGTPCTIRHNNGMMIPEPPYESTIEKYSDEFKQSMKNISSDLNQNVEILKAILAKPSTTKGDKEEIMRLFIKFTDYLSSTVPFIEKSFVEQMDKTVTEAKGEIEAFITRRITEEGRNALLGAGGDAQIFLQTPKDKTDEQS